ncbi:MAG TPA: YqgE/AlgH family protein [Pasteurellaceae bacterium]|nr:YqgE/AlgH family protein [Pasteurellaceae bacterium]
MELQDHFLIAMPQLEDSYFQRSVIYICEHNEQGTMGLVLNQPTDLSIAELMAKMNFMMASNHIYPDELVLAGGPVNMERGFILHTITGQSFQHSYKVNDNLQLTTSADIIETFGTPLAPEKYLVTLGCASWSPNQLENEIADNSWLVVPANEHILFDLPYQNRWLAANQLLGIQNHNFAYQAGHC